MKAYTQCISYFESDISPFPPLIFTRGQKCRIWPKFGIWGAVVSKRNEISEIHVVSENNSLSPSQIWYKSLPQLWKLGATKCPWKRWKCVESDSDDNTTRRRCGVSSMNVLTGFIVLFATSLPAARFGNAQQLRKSRIGLRLAAQTVNPFSTWRLYVAWMYIWWVCTRAARKENPNPNLDKSRVEKQFTGKNSVAIRLQYDTARSDAG